MNYVWHLLVMLNLYAILSLSLNLILGYTGLLSLCHAASYGIGAYACALLMVGCGWGFLPSLCVGLLIAALLSLLIGIPSLRLRGDYFVLATLGFQVIIFVLLYNWTGLTRGPYGIPGIPTPQLGGIKIDNPFRYFLFSLGVGAICGLLLWFVSRSPFGRALKAVREDETAASAMGKNPALLKVAAFSTGAVFASVAGALFAGYVRYIDPTSFTLMESIFVVSIVVIGGAGRFAGPLVGAAIMVLLPEALRFLHVPDAIAANLRQIVYGLLLIVLMRWRPQGVAGEYRFE